jgi:hypothetical protein
MAPEMVMPLAAVGLARPTGLFPPMVSRLPPLVTAPLTVSVVPALLVQLCAAPRVTGLMMETAPALAFIVMPLLSVIVLPAVPSV